MKSNYRNLFWGLFLIFLTVYLIVGKLGLIKNMGLIAGASFFDIILGIIFLVTLIKGVAKISFEQIFFSLAALGIIFDKQLHIESITPWIILLAALLMSIAMNMIFPKAKKHSVEKKSYDTFTYSERHLKEETISGNGIYCQNIFGESTKYIVSDNFSYGEFICKFGELNIYLTDVIIQENSANVDICLRCGALTLFVPKQWRVDCQSNKLFASINIQGQGSHDLSAKALIIKGDVMFGELKIVYV